LIKGKFGITQYNTLRNGEKMNNEDRQTIANLEAGLVNSNSTKGLQRVIDQANKKAQCENILIKTHCDANRIGILHESAQTKIYYLQEIMLACGRCSNYRNVEGYNHCYIRK